jgi:hypothetical protein
MLVDTGWKMLVDSGSLGRYWIRDNLSSYQISEEDLGWIFWDSWHGKHMSHLYGIRLKIFERKSGMPSKR